MDPYGRLVWILAECSDGRKPHRVRPLIEGETIYCRKCHQQVSIWGYV